MCGILFALSSDRRVDRDQFEAARDAMFHRGPDAAGAIYLRQDHVALGHRRLAIIELSEKGNQPMQLGSLTVTYNGEIYNYRVLRSALEKMGCVFRTESDTEILLHGYRIWGQELCSHLRGMFAFVLWDDERQIAYLGRDHVGQKPMYIAECAGIIAIGSEIGALQCYFGNVFGLRPESLVDSCYYDYVPDPYTWYQGIESIEAGHCGSLSFRKGRFARNFWRYWDYSPTVDPEPIAKEVASELIEERIHDAISSHLISDVEVGALLSGGLDSNCIVANASKMLREPIKTFSVGFGSLDEDELPVARTASVLYGTAHHECLVSEAQFSGSVEEMVRIFDQPFSDTSAVPTYRVARAAAEQVKVVLTGDGGDEVFGGYDYGWYRSPFLATRGASIGRRQLIRDRVVSVWERAYFCLLGSEGWARRKNFLKRRPNRMRMMQLFANEIVDMVGDYDPAWVYYRHRVAGLDPFRQAQWLGIKIPLVSKMLVKVDRCTMANSLEARAPFLDPALIESVLDLPSSTTNAGPKWFKSLLRQLMRGVIPAEVLVTKKRGFSTPAQWKPANLGIESLNFCIEEGIIRESAWGRIAGNAKLYWRLLQVEEALTKRRFKP